MPLHFSGRDKDGTHRISGSSEPQERTLPFGMKESYGVGVITDKTIAKTKWSEQNPLSLYVDLDNPNFVNKNVFKLQGDVCSTDLSTFAIYLNGFELDPSEYIFDHEVNHLTLRRNITPTDTYLEVRSAPSKFPAIIVDNILILPVSKYISADMLKNFIPEFTDVLDVERISAYPHNHNFDALAGYSLGAAEVLTCTVRDSGLYGTVKFTLK